MVEKKIVKQVRRWEKDVCGTKFVIIEDKDGGQRGIEFVMSEENGVSQEVDREYLEDLRDLLNSVLKDTEEDQLVLDEEGRKF